ncbi:hypothetical protein GO684_03350 [Wolbachia endosymbiont of Litomosoides brasiliensis]|uniref:hypothetical protein n=1 Tax=Wolbachia endosymbiont of Litomosoides brasiliensis TaxID=1812117 RepID=UPI00158F559F|nr:hypothetical protein [Wolbachia endosymbiont of Litomosoides brasiliensis]NUY39687.1 hypothetical protein [Wolbachia endosymbiont of Litomosoides brasiliensis]
MGDQVNSKKGSARGNAINAIMVGFFCAVTNVGISSGICVDIRFSFGIVLY